MLYCFPYNIKDHYQVNQLHAELYMCTFKKYFTDRIHSKNSLCSNDNTGNTRLLNSDQWYK